MGSVYQIHGEETESEPDQFVDGESQSFRPPSRTNVPTRVFEDGLEFGKYRITRLVGRGGMSEVYEALHTGLKKRVAVKVLRPEFLENEAMTERFLREGENAARIQHPNVIDTIDVGQLDGAPYLVMEYIEGEPLDDLFVREGELSVEKAANIMLPILSAVSCAHEQGVIHRDLKPDNVLLAGNDGRIRPKVLDFGVSRLLDASNSQRLTIDRGVLGTPHYMSPEQARGEATGTKSDQYSLGVMLYEAVTGRLPHDRDSILELLHIVARGDFEKPSKFRPDIPEGLEALIVRAMSHAPEERFRTIRDMGTALLPFASERAQVFWAPEFADDASSPSSKMPAAAPVAASTASVADSGAASDPVAAEPPAAAAAATSDAGRSKRGWLIPVVLVALLGGAAAAFFMTRKPDAPAATKGETFVVQVQAEPAGAKIKLDGKDVGTGSFATRLPVDGVAHQMVVSADGHEPRSLTFTDAPPPGNIRLVPSAAAPEADDSAPTPSAESAAPAAKPARRYGRFPVAKPKAGAKPEPTASETAAAKPEPAPKPAATTKPSWKSGDNKNPWKSGGGNSDNKNPWN